jgi:hypothetical protein
MFRGTDVLLTAAVKPLKNDPAFHELVKVIARERDSAMRILAFSEGNSDYNRGVFAALLSLTDAIERIYAGPKHDLRKPEPTKANLTGD